ncbi:putative FBD-associated F-box protein [Salvia divinorum]|uniref:FBD-associated F-box protein n=1 Tax=Salvia divinorum TaxID=28513 RepID=A0ABD1FVM3_SALDI
MYSDFAIKCDKKETFYGDDCISRLPDDLLITILSRLTLKEAAVASFLSRRWRYLWTNVASLDFDADDKLDSIAADHELRTKYIGWVNHVLRQHRGPTLDLVRICFDLDNRSSEAIDNWVEFATAKRVQRLELDLLGSEETRRWPTNNYTFPCKPGMSTGLKRLKALSLRGVNVSEEALDCFLLMCPELQKLSLCSVEGLKKVKVVGFKRPLKCLEIDKCLGIDTIEISNSSIVSFSYEGPVIDLMISNAPVLGDVSIGEGHSALQADVFGQLSCCLYQLESLRLNIYYTKESTEIFSFPVLPNLRQLILVVGAWDDDSLLEFAYFVNACPNLNRFALKLIWMSIVSPPNIRRETRRAPKCAHEHLKLVEIGGYYGRTSDAEIAIYFIENAVALQKIVIDPRNQVLNRSPLGVAQIERQESARRHAREHLGSKIPPQLKLVIL